MMHHAYKMSLEWGRELCFLDCKPHLLPLYRRLGFRRYMESIDDPQGGVFTPMCMVLNDLAYLQYSRSPFAATARRLLEDSPQPRWCEPFFQAALGGQDDPEAFAGEWSRQFAVLEEENAGEYGLLSNFGEQELKKLLALSEVLKAKRGQSLARRGTVNEGNEAYVILRGSVKLAVGDVDLLKLGPGASFGEACSLLRTPWWADAIVVSESAELLIFNRRSIERLRNQDPDLLAALLYNVARVLALRLRTALFDRPELRDES
jgi:CRP-like cAMP-binding protein